MAKKGGREESAALLFLLLLTDFSLQHSGEGGERMWKKSGHQERREGGTEREREREWFRFLKSHLSFRLQHHFASLTHPPTPPFFFLREHSFLPHFYSQEDTNNNKKKHSLSDIQQDTRVSKIIPFFIANIRLPKGNA